MKIKKLKHTLKRNKDKHSLRGKIRRYILLSFLTTTFIFISVFGYLGLKMLLSFSINTSEYISSSIFKEMSSEEFLSAHKLKSLRDFSSSSYKYNEWKTNLDRDLSLKILDDIMLFPTMDAAFNENTSISSVENKKPHEYPVTTLVEITINNKRIYSNLQSNKFLSNLDFDARQNIDTNIDPNMSIRINPNLSLAHPFKHISTIELKDENNNVIGTIKSQLNPRLIAESLTLAILLIIIAFFAALIGALALSWLSSIAIIRPINQLERKILAISKEDFESNLNTRIYLKKPLIEIESIAGAANEIMKKMKAYSIQIGNQNRILEFQNAELESQNLELIESRTQIENAKQKLQLKEKSVRMLLDNAGQGFLSFGKDLFIDDEYSQECIKLLGDKVKKQYFPQLFFYNDEEQKSFMEKILKRILTEKDSAKRQLYIPLLCDEIKINNRTLHIDYKVINDIDNDNEDDVMVVLTDITDKRNLENQIAQERNTLKMVVKVIVNYSDFTSILNYYYNFCRNELNQIFNKGYNLEKVLTIIYREIHTFKGNFSLLCMDKTVNNLHSIESTLVDIKNDEDITTVEDLKLFIEDCSLESIVNEDLITLKEILGVKLFDNENMIFISKSKLMQIEKKMIDILSPLECRSLLPELMSLHSKPLNETLSCYSEYVEKLAGNLNKLINPLIIKGDPILINDDIYQGFIKSLVHVFRNIVDHGIESPEERVENGKSEYGTISCRFNLVDQKYLSIVINDDGRGIAIDKIIQQALKKNIYNEYNIEKLSEEQLLHLIFKDGISTKNNISYLSGRGVGLAAVKHEVDKLNGEIKVKTKTGEGTEMTFILPYNTSAHVSEISVHDILNPLMEGCVNFITQELKLSFIPEECVDIKSLKKLPLSQFSIFINLKGIIKGKIILSLDESLAKIITRHLILDELTSEQESEFIEDTIAEFCNIILGTSLKMIPFINDLITIEVPVAISSENASFSCATSQIWGSKLAFESGNLTLGFSSSDTLINNI